MFTYWGRRGMSLFALNLMRAALASSDICATISVSRQNEDFGHFSQFGEVILPINTFSNNVGAMLQAWRLPIIRNQLRQHIAATRPDVVIELIPHIWSPFIGPTIKAAGVRYATILHDAKPHAGDYRSRAIEWATRRTLRQADLVLTLSGTVAKSIEATRMVPPGGVFQLFHPDLDFGAYCARTAPQPGEPLRLAFLGRIMAYKGLNIFLDMVEELRLQGFALEVAVCGEGNLKVHAVRLRALGVEVVNRWLTHGEIAELLRWSHALVLSHIEASQSGVAAAAFGAGLPVIATSTGGIIEQVEDGVTGVLASRADGIALADAAKRLLCCPALYNRICDNITSQKAGRSMTRFFEQCVDLALHGRSAFGGDASR